MTFDELMREYDLYLNPNGMFTVPAKTIGGNDVLYTAYALCGILDNCLDMPETFKDQLSESLLLYISPDGTTLKNPQSRELESGDNLHGWGLLSFYLSPMFAKLILKYARRNQWQWPGHEDSFKRWIGRHRALEAHLQLATKEESPDYLMQFFWCIAVLSGCITMHNRSDQDGYALAYCLVRVARYSPDAPVSMKCMVHVWDFFRSITKRSMRQSLEDYGWINTPHAKYIVDSL